MAKPTPIFGPLPPALLGLLLAVCLGSGSARAAVYLGIDDERLAASAQAIVLGSVAGADVQEVHGRPMTHQRIAVERWIKGQGDGVVTVAWPGGVVDGRALRLAGTPTWSVGDRVLLFLDARGDGTWALHQWTLGAFLIRDGDGGSTAERDLSQAREVVLPPLRRPRQGPRHAAAFVSWLERRSLGLGAAADYFVENSARSQPQPAAAAAPLPYKYRLTVSSTEPPPLGCGTDGGHFLRRFDFDAFSPVNWRAHFRGQSGLADGGIGALQRALAAWSEDPFSTVELAFVGVTSHDGGLRFDDGTNAFLFGDPNDEIAGSFVDGGVLAVAAPWHTCSTVSWDGREVHPILESDVVTQDGLELLFALAPQPDRLAEQIFGHQLGHTLGLGLSQDPDSLMAPELHQDPRGAALAVDDLRALLFLYPRGDEPSLPGAPRNLAAGTAAGAGVTLSWTAGDGASNHRLERATDDGPFEHLGTAAPDATEAFDRAVEPATTYRYRLRAQNAAGASAFTAAVTVLTPDSLAPATPSQLRGAPLTADRIRLTWQDNSCDEESFRLEILHQGEFTEIPFALAADSRTVIVSGLDPARLYTFRIVARNAYGDSPPSPPAEVRTLAADAACQVATERLCLADGRFAVELEFREPSTPDVRRIAKAVPDGPANGSFWFFNARNLEVSVEMVDSRADSGHFGVRYKGLSDLPYALTITDTETGAVRVYENPAGSLCGGEDPTAFVVAEQPLATPSIAGGRADDPVPSPLTLDTRPLFTAGALTSARSACDQPPGQLALRDGRFLVELNWMDEGGAEHQGVAVALTDHSGLFRLEAADRADWAVKLLDGRPLNDSYWLFSAPLPGVEGRLRVRDTLTGAERIYFNPAGEVCGIADLRAFQD